MENHSVANEKSFPGSKENWLPTIKAKKGSAHASNEIKYILTK